ncbi:hypothetical protein AN6664.2 [Aspergillus nidulans FGSC A4]|uniref:LysM domain-containing protein n=1 Tax=Emericella nidulans (strain FGSC A4 / ATCC 38163 / CBS 112.46 / NRRL 194 / M139) TaxID=227321 RepID=Q5AYG6_EMENI|nr:hypothetical protein [Aspergillus nidulans FGSC A4]EAA58193.1 hypothetical protein AN6664.2 [Aspergillus nidulans FGSC A4]CBF71205.1 TPA: hypothetical protein ANIA_06664 [Aspergillus nidulans FGSC A4]|eukprot:XP_664268.1 hypothetical protein AN6664.2 [Aspergillus nidulans FGSC A4]
MVPNPVFLLTLALSLAKTSLAVRGYSRRVDTPQLPFDPNTTPYCTWWIDNDGSSSCSDILSDWIISLDDFRRWNPSITAGCGGLETGKSYCVEAWGEPVPTTSTSLTTTAVPITTTTTTKTGNAPGPTQSGQVETCNRWDLVQDGDTCSVYLEKYPGLSLAKLVEWNPAIGSQCQNLWVETYLCTGIEGWSAPTTTTATTTTSPPGNGIPTPTPTQPGMIADCNAFHEVKSGDTCANIAQSAGISVSQFTAWNSGVGTGCTSLWLGYFVCVSRVGATATMTTTTTSAGNGIATPTPTLPGMVANCDAFYLVRSGDGCAAIASSKGISLAQLYAWNTNLGTSCTGLWAEYYVCVSIVGVSPTTTTKTTTRTATTTRTTTTQGNGVATPTPIQPGMTTSCKKFHKVVSGDQCGTIASKAGITLVNFLRWNPGVGGSACSSLWLGYYVCIAVL